MPDEPVPDQGVQPVQEDAAPAPEIDQDAPWSSDLNERFDDAEVRAQVDQYVRDTVQPYVTQLEQGSAEDRFARKLWTDFTENPADTYIQVTREMFGEDAAGEVESLLDNLAEGESFSDDEDLSYAPEINEAELPPRLQEAVEGWEAQQQEDHYYDEIERVAAENPELGISDNEELFHPFVAAAEGDFDQAVQGYANWMESIGAKAADGSLDVQAPNVIGSDTPGSTTPPVEEHYDSLDDALDSFMGEINPAPPTI